MQTMFVLGLLLFLLEDGPRAGICNCRDDRRRRCFCAGVGYCRDDRRCRCTRGSLPTVR